MKKIFLLLFLFSFSFSFSQDIEKADKEFLKKYNKSSESTYFNIYLSSKDCYRCLVGINNLLSFVVANKSDLEINIVTDNIILAKKETSSYPLKINYSVDKLAFNDSPKSFYYLKKDGVIVDKYDELVVEFQKKPHASIAESELRKFTNIGIRDSLFSDGELFAPGILNGKFIIYDKTLSRGGIITSGSHSLVPYDVPLTSKKMYEIPKFQFENEELMSYESFLEHNKNDRLPGIKISVISIHENVVYTQFVISQLFKNLKKANDYSIYSYGYIAVKEMKKGEDVSTIFDIDSYDSYFYMDDLKFEGKPYRFGVSIYYPIIERKDKNNFVVHIYSGSTYVGEADVEFKNNFKEVGIKNINFKDKAIYAYLTLKSGEDDYYVFKESIDESNGIGKIVLRKVKKKNG
ncbi:MAG: hypothetical protein LBE34_07370 [Flavobacteriaceae bacterium]|jgi:hypothetical protein|nr:hypothetical protein [Flavobacteriaceae bacterium]